MKKVFNKKATLIVLGAIMGVSATLFACINKEPTQQPDENPVVVSSRDYALLLDNYKVENYTLNVKVYDANNKIVSVSEEGEFIIRTPGVYTIDYGTQKTYLYTYAKMPKSTFVYSKDIKDAQFVAGDTLHLPILDIQNVAKDYVDYTVTVSLDGNEVESFEGGVGNTYFVATSGNYSLTYSFENVFGVTESDSIEFSAIDEKRIVYAKEPELELALGSSVTYNSYGYYLSNNYDSSIMVVSPSGDVTTNKKVVFNEFGEYTLSFTSNISGTVVVDEFKVNTTLDKTALFSNGQNLNYVREDKLDELCLDSSGSPNLVGIDGIKINASDSSSVIYYSSIIDLTKKTYEDKLIEFFVDKNNGSLTDMCVTLVDVYDPSITVRYNWMQNQWNSGMSYGKVSVNNQVYFWKNGNSYDTYFGIVLGCGYTAGVANGSFSIAFDWATQSTYMGSKLIADFKDEASVPPSFNWSGFTTGEVYLRIEFSKCTNGGIIVQSVDGKEISNVDVTALKDERALCISSEYDVLPTGVKGKQYPLPTVIDNKAVELYNVQTSIYLGDVNKSSLINANNSFTPDVAGTYTVNYKAVDSFGKVVTKSYDIIIEESATPIVINGGFGNQTVDIMGYYQLPEFTPSGGHGNLSTEVSVKLNGKELPKTKNGYFVDEKGDLTVSIKAVDYVGNIKTEEFDVEINDDVQIFNHAILPRSVFVGDVVNFDVSAINYQTGNDMDVTVYVNDKKVTGEYVVPTGISNLRVLFIAKDGTNKTKVSDVYNIPVNSGSLNNIADYVQTDFTSEKISLSSGVVYKLDGQKSEYGFELPYYLAAYEFAFKFGFNDANINASKVTLTLQDAKNPNETVNIYFTQLTSDKALIKVNDDIVEYSTKWSKATYATNCGNFANSLLYKGKSYRTLELILDIYTNTLLDSAGMGVATIKKYANGEKFNGFTSGAVLCTFKVSELTGKSEFILANVCNQSFGYRVHGEAIRDNAEPIIGFTKKFEKYAFIGDVYQIPAIYAYDVLSLGATLTLQVKAPDGTKIVDNYSLNSGYSFTISQYGIYRIILTATDINGISRSMTTNLQVEYDKVPELTVNGEVKSTFKVGETLTIPSYTVKENISAGEIEVRIFLRDTDGALHEVNGSYTFTKAGNYQLVYRATDEYYNVTRIVFNINVQ